MGKRAVLCKSHCSSCGRHFANDSAFDRHRQGPVDGRRCVDPATMKSLGVKSHTGVCTIASDYLRSVGQVWTLASSLHGSAERLEASFPVNRKAQEAA